MSSTTARGARGDVAPGAAPQPPRAPGPPRPPDLSALQRSSQLRARRSPRWIAAGVLAICLGALGAVLLWDGAVTSQQVLRVNSAVARGEVIEAGDLGPVTIGSLPGVSVVVAEELAPLVGQHALVDLPAGSLVPAGGIGAPVVAEGTARMGLALPAGRLPSGTLVPGEALLLIPVPAPDDTSREARQPVVRGTLVSAPAVGPDGVSTLVDVTVAVEDAEAVARLAATDRLVLARVG